MSFLSSILKNSSQSVGAGLISAVGSFAASVIVARVLGVEGTATVSMALWIVFLTSTLADLGITGTLARFVAECSRDATPDAARRLASYSLRKFLLAILGGLLLGGAFLWFYWNDIEAKYSSGPGGTAAFCSLVLLCFVVHMLNSFAYQYLRGLRAFKAITLYSLIGTCLQVAGVALGSLAYGANGALVGYIVFSVPILWSLKFVRLPGRIDTPLNKSRMRSYAISFYMAVLFSPLLWVRADILIVDQMIGATGVGLFAAAATVAALLLQVCQMICNALLPNIVHAAEGDRESFEKVSRTAVRLSLTLLIPACIISAAAAPEAIVAIFGTAFAGGGTAAALLCLGASGSALTLVVASVMNADEANAALARNGIFGAIMTVASGIAFTFAFGLIGAAMGRFLSQGLVGLLNARSANGRVGQLVTAGFLARVSLAGLLGGAVTESVGWWTGPSVPALILALVLGGLTYLLAAALLIPFSGEERGRLAAMLEKRPAHIRKPANWLLSLGRTL